MKLHERKTVAVVKCNDGRELKYEVSKHGNMSYRVFLDSGAPVDFIYNSYEDAVNYALKCATGHPQVLLKRATVEFNA